MTDANHNCLSLNKKIAIQQVRLGANPKLSNKEVGNFKTLHNMLWIWPRPKYNSESTSLNGNSY